MGQEGALLLERLCRRAAETMRVTGARRSLLCCMAAQPKHAWSADELLESCNCPAAGTISRAGVYRTLEQLESAGLVAAHEVPLNSRRRSDTGVHQRYALRPEVLCEIELTDESAGKSEPIACTPELRRALVSLCRRHRFAVDELSIEVRGRFK